VCNGAAETEGEYHACRSHTKSHLPVAEEDAHVDFDESLGSGGTAEVVTRLITIAKAELQHAANLHLRRHCSASDLIQPNQYGKRVSSPVQDGCRDLGLSLGYY
jgi:hypothetical protein